MRRVPSSPRWYKRETCRHEFSETTVQRLVLQEVGADGVKWYRPGGPLMSPRCVWCGVTRSSAARIAAYVLAAERMQEALG